MAMNFPKLVKHKIFKKLRKTQVGFSFPRHLIVKIPRVKDEEETLKVARGVKFIQRVKDRLQQKYF